VPTDEAPTAEAGGNQQRREDAKRRLRSALAQQAQRARRRKALAIGTAAVVVLVVALGSVYYATSDQPSAEPAPPGASGAAAHATSGPCHYTSTPAEPAAKPVAMPPDPNPTPSSGTAKISLRTNQGAIPLTLNRAEAPCTAQNFEHLAASKFFDGTRCHRISTNPKMLQCGDPSGTGSGGPGYQFRDETKPGTTYPRGALAMANSGPNTNGSQFFLVFGDSPLPPNYTVFGTVDQPGLQVLDRIAAAGTADGSGDGPPKLPVQIDSATAA
jgi:peptidyl-prolyl cis-trans isomerase B (cyclophilin B)